MTGVAADDWQELRSNGRTNLYLAASLRWPGGATAVRVRNLSARGAMVEAPVLPLAGTTVELVRGALQVHGSTAWSSGNRAGLRLDELVAVREWMGNGGNPAQQRIDGLVRALRSGNMPTFPQRPMTQLASAPAEDLRLAGRLLEQLGDVLVADMEVVARYGSDLQSMDVVQQLLEALARAGSEPDRGVARLADLRASAQAILAG